jgi:flagellar basal-body rod modification protein FlgD
MNSVSDVSPSALSSITSNSTGSVSLGEEDFLTLLVAQLEHQDPLDPQDNSEFIAQLAQFSTLEQQTSTNKNLEALLNSNQSIEQLSAFSLLGQTVTAEQDRFTLGDEAVEIGFDLEQSATNVSLAILDESNSVISTIEVENLATGINFITWDGTDSNGNQLSPGDYTVLATAIYGDDSSTALTTLQRAQVTGIDTSDQTLLETSQGSLKLSQLRSVSST